MMMILVTKEYDEGDDKGGVNVKQLLNGDVNAKHRLEEMYPAPNVALSWTVK